MEFSPVKAYPGRWHSPEGYIILHNPAIYHTNPSWSAASPSFYGEAPTRSGLKFYSFEGAKVWCEEHYRNQIP